MRPPVLGSSFLHLFAVDSLDVMIPSLLKKSEVLMGGYVVPGWVKAQALDKLVPQEQLSVIVSRSELADYKAKLLWVKAQMEHARGATQAQQVSTTAAPGSRWRRQ